MLVRLIEATWAAEAEGRKPHVIEGDLTFDEILEYNSKGFNCYTWPNHPSAEAYAAIPINPRTGLKCNIKGSNVDVFRWVYADFDLKSGTYPSKDAFYEKLLTLDILPTKVNDTGNGLHAYWAVSDLDSMSFLRLNRRISTFLKTDPAVSTLNQILRIENTYNVKNEDEPKLCETIWDEPDNVYTAEQLDQWLPPITAEDEAYCVRHYDTAYNTGTAKVKVPTELPKKFLDLCKHDKEAKALYYDKQEDRSTADFTLGLRLFNVGFTRDEALAVMCRTQKALERAPVHQYNYGFNIVDKIWEEEAAKVEAAKTNTKTSLKYPVTTIADVDAAGNIEGERIYCNPMIDATERGFRLGDVMGLIGGSGNGKSTTALNIFRWFTEYNVNKDFIHLFISLEMPKTEVTQRWKRMSAELSKSNPAVDWNKIVYVLDNYNEDGTYRELGLDEIQEYVLELEKVTGKKVGCLVVDHLGIIRQKKSKKDSENDGLTGVCKQLKAVAMRTRTFFIIQSQTSRAKNAGGDVELDMDAAFGTSAFENFSDFVFTTWQPLKRIVGQMDKNKPLLVTAFKLAKVRNKNVLLDKIQADQVYGMAFDPHTELLRELTSDEHKAYDTYWNPKAIKARNKDKKRDPSQLVTITWTATKRIKSDEVSKT